MLTTEQRKADICKIIKAFLIFKPESTSKEIINFLGEHEFGINKNLKLTPQRLSRLILNKSNESLCHWFNVEMIKKPGHPIRWRIVE